MTIPWEIESDARPPDRLFGYVSAESQGGTSVLEAEEPTSAEPFFARDEQRQEATRAAEASGLEVVAESRLGQAVAGPPEAFEDLTGGTIVARERLLHAEAGIERYVTHFDIVGDRQPDALGVGVAASDQAHIEAVLLERPRIPHAVFPSPVPPTVSKFHLRVPDDVSLLLGAARAHRDGREGEGVTVAMVDTGQYPHPFFLAHGYDVRPTVTLVSGTSPVRDPVGHGTGESANIFAVAPAATLRPYRASDAAGRLVAAIGAFLRAKDDRPDVLTNSWGGDGPYPPPGPPSAWAQAWALEIMDAVEQGIVVVFSAGNGHFSVEPQAPGVLSAGGTYSTIGLDLRASDYASGYESPWFGGVRVPTVCGLVGLRPRAQYILLPVPPRSEIDVAESEAAAGDTPDGTTPSDGWALFSGTSAAAPQLAGAAAVLLGAQPGLTPQQVREALSASTVDVRFGRCHPRFDFPAGSGRDVATGFGLADVSAAADQVVG
jgi:subtilisin family serine protease